MMLELICMGAVLCGMGLYCTVLNGKSPFLVPVGDIFTIQNEHKNRIKIFILTLWVKTRDN